MSDLAGRIALLEPELARAAVDRTLAAHPEILERWGPDGVHRCVEDVAFHVRFLCGALDADDPDEFAGYRIWAEQLFETIGIPREHLIAGFDALAALLEERFGAEAAQAVAMLRS